VGQQQLLLIILGVVIIGIAVMVGIAMFQDNALEHNRAQVINDLKTLGAKAQHYYSRPSTMGGGNRSFVGLTADVREIGLLAGIKYSDNANGTYTIKTAGSATEVVLLGVGKVQMSDGTFPEYDETVTTQSQTMTKIN
jgi:hypothetical protein